jgi:hypothetical protein
MLTLELFMLTLGPLRLILVLFRFIMEPPWGSVLKPWRLTLEP